MLGKNVYMLILSFSLKYLKELGGDSKVLHVYILFDRGIFATGEESKTIPNFRYASQGNCAAIFAALLDLLEKSQRKRLLTAGRKSGSREEFERFGAALIRRHRIPEFTLVSWGYLSPP